jgi:Flp pilus assembly protein TadG
MKGYSKMAPVLRDQQGAYAIIIGLLLIVFLGFLALAIDMGYLWVAQNELQNAADAGALAGALSLINEDGSINTNANQIAYDAATANKSTRKDVEVHPGDVQRGHWSVATRTFTPNPNTTQVDFWSQTEEELDANVNFINAVRVVTRRQDIPVDLFVAGILGHDSKVVTTDAVAYVGFVGNQEPFGVDMPIAICAEALEASDDLCTYGRMIGGEGGEASETGAWTDLAPCDGGASDATEIWAALQSGCNGQGANSQWIYNGVGLTTNNGMVEGPHGMDYFRDCWLDKTGGVMSWHLTLPVIICEPNIAPCNIVDGSVDVRVVWVSEKGTGQLTAPETMAGWGEMGTEHYVASWSGSGTTEERWASFVDHFKLINMDGSSVPLWKKSIYFVPDCTHNKNIGDTGGANYGKLAERPKLVE